MTWRNVVEPMLASAGGVLLAAAAIAALRAALQARDTARQLAELLSATAGRHARVDGELDQLRADVTDLQLWRASMRSGRHGP